MDRRCSDTPDFKCAQRWQKFQDLPFRKKRGRKPWPSDSSDFVHVPGSQSLAFLSQWLGSKQEEIGVVAEDLFEWCFPLIIAAMSRVFRYLGIGIPWYSMILQNITHAYPCKLWIIWLIWQGIVVWFRLWLKNSPNVWMTLTTCCAKG